MSYDGHRIIEISGASENTTLEGIPIYNCGSQIDYYGIPSDERESFDYGYRKRNWVIEDCYFTSIQSYYTGVKLLENDEQKTIRIRYPGGYIKYDGVHESYSVRCDQEDGAMSFSYDGEKWRIGSIKLQQSD